MEDEREEGEVRKEDLERWSERDKTAGSAPNKKEEQNDSLGTSEDPPPSPPKVVANIKTKMRPKRDVRTLNYAFGEPRTDEAANEAQEWLDSLSIAEDEENNPTLRNFPQGLKYRSASANQSPQMLDRLQRCQENQEPYDPPKNRIMSAEKNASQEIHEGLHEEDNCNRPNNVWKGRRSAAGNNSSSVYAILHPSAEICDRHKWTKEPARRRNHLRDHMAAIAEMSSLTHMYKEEEKKHEAKGVESIKHWCGRKPPQKTVKSRHGRTNFVAKNIKNITEQSASVRAFREDPLPDVLSSHKENMGKVPEYLCRIKTELAEEAQQRVLEKAAKSFPPGRRLMSEMNRKHILHKLENRHKELIHTLKSFPLTFDTPRQIQLKSSIEKQLKNIEASYSYYNNPRVFISCLDINCPTCSGLHMDSCSPQESLQRVPDSHTSHSDDIWDHVACAAGIQRSPRPIRSPHFESNFIKINDSSAQGATSLTRKRRNQEEDNYISPSKRQFVLPQKLFQKAHTTSIPATGGWFCKTCFDRRKR